MILLLDNYDSFTYNLYQMIGKLYPYIQVTRSDAVTLDEIDQMDPQAIILSPGPGYPKDAGVSVEAVRRFSGKIPILGVCLGHQAIGEAFGGKVIQAAQPFHGKASELTLDTSSPLFQNLPPKITAARYHSLIVEDSSMPEDLQVIARDGGGQVMAVAHREHPTYGLQFHPESIMTPEGEKILSNFLQKIAGLEIQGQEQKAEAMPPEQRNALKPYIFKVIDGDSLTREEAYDAMDCIMSGGATDAQIGSFLTALRMKGETIDEITGFAQVMRRKAAVVPCGTSAVDIVGTGGDMANTFNISTTAAFVAAGAGLKVAKHGNRSVSSRSGAADVLEALGVNISMTPEQAMECLEKCGLVFLFAPCFHGSMRFAAASRREIGVRSVFNILGPLSNPALADYIVLGVYDEALMETMARVLMNLGIKGAMLVHGSDGLDEITVTGATRVCEVRDGKLIKYDLEPEGCSIPLADKAQLVGGTAEENAVITLEILQGKETGPKRDIVVLNAACALYTAGLAADIPQGAELARKSILSGSAMEKLEALKAATAAYRKS